MRWLGVALCLLCLAVVAGCGADDEPASADLPGSLGYVPRDASLVMLVPTDPDGEQLHRLERLVAPTLRAELGGETIPEVFDAVLADTDVRFERDIKPLLGGTLVLGTFGALDAEEVILALETTDGEKLTALLRRLDLRPGSDGLAVDGNVLIVGDTQESVDAAVARHEDGAGFDPDRFSRALGDAAGDDALVRMYGDPQALAPELGAGAEMPWIRALESAALTITLEEDAIAGRLSLRTRPDGLSEEDLPLEPGDESPEAGDVDRAIAAANRNQSHTTVFLVQLARRAFPNSRFVREVEALEADLGIEFEQEVLAQFNGPSASIATPDGDFAAVSDLADPERMRALLPRLAPRLPAVLRGLQGLGNRGLVALLLFAPDAPLTPGMLPALGAQIEVQPVPGGDDEQLYEITGLDEPTADGEPGFAGPGTAVFGMIGDRFVVGTNAERARSAAAMDVSAVDGAEGAGVARADLSTWSRETVEDAIGFATLPLGEAVGELEASLDGVEGRLRVAVPDGLD